MEFLSPNRLKEFELLETDASSTSISIASITFSACLVLEDGASGGVEQPPQGFRAGFVCDC